MVGVGGVSISVLCQLCAFKDFFPVSTLSFHLLTESFIQQMFSVLSPIYHVFILGIMLLMLCQKTLNKALGPKDFLLYCYLKFYSLKFKYMINFELILCKL